jgi:hypothetical protein
VSLVPGRADGPARSGRLTARAGRADRHDHDDGREEAGVLWLLVSVLGFAVLTAAVVAMARSDTARWEREKMPTRAHAPVHRRSAGVAPPHARRRRVEFTRVLPVPRVPVGESAPLPVGTEGPAGRDAS